MLKDLVVIISEEENIEAKLEEIIKAISKLFFGLKKQIIKKRELSTTTKVRIENVLYIFVLTYGLELGISMEV